MTDAQQREAARQFIYRWRNRGNEDEDARSYWLEILSEILGVEHATERVNFEKKVIGPDGNTKRIDVYIPETHVLIEQKSLGIALDKPQAGHGGKTPYEQAKMYDNGLSFSERARWIVTSNFAEIWIYDREQKKPEPVKLALEDLQSKYHMLDFLVNRETKKVTDEMKLSLDAGRLVGQIYDAFLKQYKNPDDPETLKSLNKLCVRIVFCLYGEDAGIFGKKNMFHDYMAQFDAAHARKGLRDLFRVLDQKPEDRDPYLSDDDPKLAAFPYVNGGLFSDENIEIPPFTDEIRKLILRDASDHFDWSEISPTIFGAVFESTLNPETRRSGGMHYTSIENIHKVIDPLFLDDLKAELEEIKTISVVKTQEKRLKAFQDKLASLTFLDPAAGSGNFLTESYLSLRKLENEALRLLSHGQILLALDDVTPIKVGIDQFYGIEINDFAVTVARTALWIAENQMMKATEDIVHTSLDFLPLKTNAHIVEGNALRIDWNDVVPKDKLNYIMGNPPFVGASMMTAKQKAEAVHIFGKIRLSNSIDYVGAWYHVAANYMQGTHISAAFVSTNSITQGEQVAPLWEKLINNLSLEIQFAYRTFIWNSEANDQAQVHCVIIGFTCEHIANSKTIFDGNQAIEASCISPYLIDMENTLVVSHSKPICPVLPMVYGNKPTDDGNFILSEDEKNEIVRLNPGIEKHIYPFVGASDYINGKRRFCFWLKDVSPNEIRKYNEIVKRIEAVKKFREASSAEPTRIKANVPQEFFFISQPKNSYILMPRHSSQKRRYIPCDFLSADNIAYASCSIVTDAGL